jgi:hypothetical protein
MVLMSVAIRDNSNNTAVTSVDVADDVLGVMWLDQYESTRPNSKSTTPNPMNPMLSSSLTHAGKGINSVPHAAITSNA